MKKYRLVRNVTPFYISSPFRVWVFCRIYTSRFLLLLLLTLCMGCANITAPTGGKKDTTPPKLLSISPKDSLLNTKLKKIEMHFDEYITVSDVTTEVEISPILSIPITVLGLNKKVTVKIVDSLLDSNTTYRIKFGKAIKDLHEGNPFKKYVYTFSTGAYFDSLQLSGTVIDAATGLPDTNGVIIELYNATAKDSDVIRKKPKYITKIDNTGSFLFKGLPKRKFRIYALKETNNNLIYDGTGEKIAFNDSTIIPGDTSLPPLQLRLFEEKVDTGAKKTDSLRAKKKIDTASIKKPPVLSTNTKKTTETKKVTENKNKTKTQAKEEPLTYAVNIDTSNIEHRTFDFANGKIRITFNKKAVFNKDKVALTNDIDGEAVNVPFSFMDDTIHPLIYQIKADYKENTVYTLRLIKGFAKDSAGADVMPSRFTFRTYQDDDYGKLKILLPAKYNDTLYVLKVKAENDSVYQQKVTDTLVILKYLKPAKYSFRLIIDKNGNGKWDTGDLFGKLQPETVIPYFETVNLKAGWEQIIDFDKKPIPKTSKEKIRNNKDSK